MSEISKLEQNLIIKKIDNGTVNISINNNDMLMAIVGQFDQNLKNLSKLTNTDVFFRGNSITCKGEKEKLSIFCDAIKFLINKYFLTNIIEKEDIVLSVKKNLELEESNVKSFTQLIKYQLFYLRIRQIIQINILEEMNISTQLLLKVM